MQIQVELYQIQYRDFNIPNSDWTILESDLTDLREADQYARAYAEEIHDVVVRVISNLSEDVVGYKFSYNQQTLFASIGNGWYIYEDKS